MKKLGDILLGIWNFGLIILLFPIGFIIFIWMIIHDKIKKHKNE